MNNATTNVGAVIDEEFTFEGYQVVRGEYFAHIFEPSFTFNNYKANVNTACIRKFPDTEYVQILVNPDRKKLAIRPCMEDEKDSLRWCTAKHAPKQITCRVFFAKVMDLMNWNPSNRYKLLGKLIQSDNDVLFIFDLTTPEIFQKIQNEDGTSKTSRKASYPTEWANQFGISVKEHQESLQVNIFDGYAVFSLEPNPPAKSVTENPSTPSATKEILSDDTYQSNSTIKSTKN